MIVSTISTLVLNLFMFKIHVDYRTVVRFILVNDKLK